MRFKVGGQYIPDSFNNTDTVYLSDPSRILAYLTLDSNPVFTLDDFIFSWAPGSPGGAGPDISLGSFDFYVGPVLITQSAIVVANGADTVPGILTITTAFPGGGENITMYLILLANEGSYYVQAPPFIDPPIDSPYSEANRVLPRIPVSELVQINSNVIDSGGNPVSLNGVFLTKNAYVPSGTVLPFSFASDVASFFGPASEEAVVAQKYFAGDDNSQTKPGTIFFAPYSDSSRSGWLQSASMADVTLTQYRDLTGTLTITVDGTPMTSSSLNFLGVTSQSDVAALIQSGFTGGPTVAWDAIRLVFRLTSPTTGVSSSLSFASGSLASSLRLMAATGATVSQGVAIDTPSSACDNILANILSWISFTTMWEPILTDKILFADWANAQAKQYVYIAWDTDNPATVADSGASFGAIMQVEKLNGVCCISGDSMDCVAQGTTLDVAARNVAAFVMGAGASIDYNRLGGRITFKFKHQSGLIPTCLDKQISRNLSANGYSFYGDYAMNSNDFLLFCDGRMPGDQKWLDNFYDDVWIAGQMQVALMTLLMGINRVSYNEAGRAQIRGSLSDPINQALNAGVIDRGIMPSNTQKVLIMALVGKDISNELYTNGYYLQILDPGAQARGNRQTPIINFFYMNGEAVQKIVIPAYDVL